MFVIFYSLLNGSDQFYLTLTNNGTELSLFVSLSAEKVQCKYFDGVWNTLGCTAVDLTADTTVCNCDHLAQFGVSRIPLATQLQFTPLLVGYLPTNYLPKARL
jgi:hypothetical protein